ncbi:MAG TPA: sigma-70 family RNA polymerase sigma factor [Candidatus Dormibacteraeota bacterium]|nr:sigma-70 family RNA polymerase sigma factor [Candidatus Dormibacteraeota bacterium]
MFQEAQSDEALATQAQGGSLTAFEELVLLYEKRIYRFVRDCCGNDTDAVEVTQDTFVKAFQAIAQFDGKHAFAAWLFTIARRKCVDRYRAQRALPDTECLPKPAACLDPSETLSHAEEWQNVWECARELLPESQYQALWLRYAEDMDLPQIALVLRKTRTHVKVLLFRARSRLTKEMRRNRNEAVSRKPQFYDKLVAQI